MSHPIFNPDDWPRVLSHGDEGAAVAAWQAVLEADGPVDITDKVGTFGDSTHNATLNWQKQRGLVGDGDVGPMTRGKIGTERIVRPDLPIAGLEEIPFVESVNWSKHLAPRKTVDLIVLHCMDGAEASTKAERVAAWFAGKNPRHEAPRASAHYFVDDDSIVQGVREDGIAWHAPGANRNGIGIEHAGRARQTRTQWLDEFGTNMLNRSARLCAGIATRWGIPIEFCDADKLRAGDARGFTTHHEVTMAFRKSTHVDPGPGFPLDWFLDRVREETRRSAANV